MAVIRIVPKNVDPEDLASFAAELRQALPGVEVQEFTSEQIPPGARAVTYWESVVVEIVVETAEFTRDAMLGALFPAAYRWARQRFKRKLEWKDRRPKVVTLRAPDGTEVGSMALRSARHKPVSYEEAMKPEPAKKRRPAKKGAKARSGASKGEKRKKPKKRR